MTYEMPAHIVRHLRYLDRELLHAALAEYALSGVVSLTERLDGMKFRHSTQLHALRERGEYVQDIFSYGTHYSLAEAMGLTP